MRVHHFTFNPFQENTYLLIAPNNDCLIIDPGCYTASEQSLFLNFIKENQLNPVGLINTHCHIDHILGNALVSKTFSLPLQAHEMEKTVLEKSPIWGLQYGIKCEQSPEITQFLKEGDKVILGEDELEVLFVPGHSLGHIALVNHSHKFVIGGDVLFKGSFGRVDLPGGNIQDLVKSIMLKLFNLPGDYTVYSGHGETTTIAHEKQSNMIYQFT